MKPETILYNALTLIGEGRSVRGEAGRMARQALRRYEAVVNAPTVRPLTCNVCRQTLPPVAFSVDRSRSSGRRPECRACMKVRREGAVRSAQDRRAAATAASRARAEGEEQKRSLLTRMAPVVASRMFGSVDLTADHEV